MQFLSSQKRAFSRLVTSLIEAPLLYQGKVRDVYAWGEDELLFVATDRVSAFDWILPTEIPDKGKILTQLSLWWFEQLEPIAPNHLVSLDVPSVVTGRAMIVQRLEMLPVEAVVRGFLTGSGLIDYAAAGAISGQQLPLGLKDGDALPEPLFTPATKAPKGQHDQTISLGEAAEILGGVDTKNMSDMSLRIYRRANELVREAGFVVADTKFEFGFRKSGSDQLILGDEVLTPDSSRYWLIDQIGGGVRPESFDKQVIRDWLVSAESKWSKDSDEPPPPLPAAVIEQTRDRYLQVFKKITGRSIQ